MDPFTLAIGAAFLVASWAAFRKGTPPPSQQHAACGGSAQAAAAQAVVGSAVGGATAGSAVPGVGTAIGAGAGAALSLVQIGASPCGKAWLKHAGQQVAAASKATCAKADALLAKLKAKGVATPAGYSHLSCDQKLATLAALASPLGITFAAADEAYSTATAAANRTVQNAQDAAHAATSAANSAAKAVKKIF